MRLLKFLKSKTFTANAVIFFIFSALISFLAGRMPESTYFYKRWLYKERSWEEGGRLYDRLFGVRRWKAKLPEMSDFLKFTFSKKHLKSTDDNYLARFVMESCRSEWTHWTIIFSSLLFLLWNEFIPAFKIILMAITLNLPYIIIQRYNRPRIVRLLEKRGYEEVPCVQKPYPG